MKFIEAMFGQLRARLAPFFDLSTLILLGVSLVPLFLIDPGMLWTLVQWCAFGLALAGIAITLCRVMLPQVKLSEYLDLAERGSISAALVVLGVVLLLAFLFVGMVLWAKA